jgi:acetyl-CoA carboxylase beta subunit
MEMIEPKKRVITTLIRCENESCGGVCFADELEQKDWRCPNCGKAISKPE